MSDKLFLMLSRVQARLSAYFKRELKKEKVSLSPGQVGILLVLDREGQTTMGRLSSILENDNAAITRLVGKLETKGLVKRHMNPHDRRQMLLNITEQGLVQAGVLKRIIEKANVKMKEGFTDDEIAIYTRVNRFMLDKFS